MILKGKVDIFRNNGSTEETQKIRALQGGEFIYAEGFFSEEKTSFYAKSVGISTVIIINKIEFMELLRTDKQNMVNF